MIQGNGPAQTGATVDVTRHDGDDTVVRLAVHGETDLATAGQLDDAIARRSAAATRR